MIEKAIIYILALCFSALGVWMMLIKKRKQVKAGAAIVVAGLGLLGVERWFQVSYSVDRSVKHYNEQQIAITNIIQNVTRVEKEIAGMREVVETFYARSRLEVICGDNSDKVVSRHTNGVAYIALLLDNAPVVNSLNICLSHPRNSFFPLKTGSFLVLTNTVCFRLTTSINPIECSFIATYSLDPDLTNMIKHVDIVSPGHFVTK